MCSEEIGGEEREGEVFSAGIDYYHDHDYNYGATDGRLCNRHESDMARKKSDHQARRVEIAEAACKVILRTGLQRTSLSDIALELGVTTGVLRHYFRNKDELLLFAKNLLFDRASERERRAAEAYTGLDRLIAVAVEGLPTTKESLDQWRILATFNGRAVGSRRLERLQHERNVLGWSLYTEEIRALQRAGFIPAGVDPELEGFGLCALVEGIAAQIIMAPRHRSAEEQRGLVRRYVQKVFASS